MNKKGIWVAIDGIDATGKTTQVSRVVPKLVEQGVNPVTPITEFSTSPVGETIREILRKNRFYALSYQKTSPMADTVLLLADMVYNYETVITPTLLAEGIAVSDRGVLSLIAYQAIRIGERSQHIPSHTSLQWTQILVRHCLVMPDFTVFIRLSPDEIMRRVISRGEEPLSVEELEFLDKADKLMERSIKELSINYAIVDGQQTIELVTEAILASVKNNFSTINTE